MRITETTKNLYADMERYLRSVIKWKKQVAEQYVPYSGCIKHIYIYM